jgi:hypothetical protein
MSAGQHYIVRDKEHGNTLVEGQAINDFTLQVETGEYSGQELMLSQVDILEKCEHSEAAGFLALAWQ